MVCSHDSGLQIRSCHDLNVRDINHARLENSIRNDNKKTIVVCYSPSLRNARIWNSPEMRKGKVGKFRVEALDLCGSVVSWSKAGYSDKCFHPFFSNTILSS